MSGLRPALVTASTMVCGIRSVVSTWAKSIAFAITNRSMIDTFAPSRMVCRTSWSKGESAIPFAVSTRFRMMEAGRASSGLRQGAPRTGPMSR